MHPSVVIRNSATNKDYTDDANGNMLARGTQQNIAWDIDNRVGNAVRSDSLPIAEGAALTALTQPYVLYDNSE